MTAAKFEQSPPDSKLLTAYDEAHLVTYLRLLDAEADGADWTEVAKIIFGRESTSDSESVKHQHDSHLARAKWIRDGEFAQLLEH